jgi:hypothetical protein
MYDENEHHSPCSTPSQIQSSNFAREWRACMMNTSTTQALEHRLTLRWISGSSSHSINTARTAKAKACLGNNVSMTTI